MYGAYQEADEIPTGMNGLVKKYQLHAFQAFAIQKRY